MLTFSIHPEYNHYLERYTKKGTYMTLPNGSKLHVAYKRPRLLIFRKRDLFEVYDDGFKYISKGNTLGYLWTEVKEYYHSVARVQNMRTGKVSVGIHNLKLVTSDNHLFELNDKYKSIFQIADILPGLTLKPLFEQAQLQINEQQSTTFGEITLTPTGISHRTITAKVSEISWTDIAKIEHSGPSLLIWWHNREIPEKEPLLALPSMFGKVPNAFVLIELIKNMSPNLDQSIPTLPVG